LQLTVFARAVFRYSDSLSDQQLRLLDLNFGHDDETVCLDIRTYSLNDHPPYIALSYTWGDPNVTVPVLCNGRVIDVTRNLKEALWQFRKDRKRMVRPKSSTMSRGQPLHFWIDAICINQTNNEEKSVQVGLMAEIYQQALHVFVWLGPVANGSDLAVRYVNTIGTMEEACGVEGAFELCYEIWHKMDLVPGGTKRLVPVEQVL
jgi:hypothetical protein